MNKHFTKIFAQKFAYWDHYMLYSHYELLFSLIAMSELYNILLDGTSKLTNFGNAPIIMFQL